MAADLIPVLGPRLVLSPTDYDAEFEYGLEVLPAPLRRRAVPGSA